MKKILFVLLIIVVVGAIGYILVNRSSKTDMTNSNTAPSPVSPQVEEVLNKEQTIDVTASGGKFSPDTFKIELFDTVDLNIKAIDRDYTFQVKGYPRLDIAIPRGKTVVAKIQYLGVGEYAFACGSGCSGKLLVVQERDTEGEED